MKVLALSLLRIGDFFQQVHLFRQIEKDLGLPELHIVAFEEVRSAAALFPTWKFHFIPRLEIQKDLVERDRPWFRALATLEESLTEVFNTEWNLILNPTHTSFSARLMDCLSGHEKRGVRFEMGNTDGWNDELRYLNDHYRTQKTASQTWIELTSRALGFELSQPDRRRTVTSGDEIWLNPLTSDERKNWPLESWQRLADMLSVTGYKVRVLGAPAEKFWLESVFPTRQHGAWSFVELRQQSHLCRLLISGDTSVPHFLALELVPLLTLFLGPANLSKTSPRAFHSAVLGIDLQCSPCEHRGSCTLPARICGQEIAVIDVYKTILNLTGGSYEQSREKNSRDRITPMACST